MAVIGACQVCGIGLAHYEECPSPACPCFGTRCGSVEMEAAATRWRSRPSIAANRCMSAEAAEQQVEMRSWLDYQRAVGDLIDVEFRHSDLP